jgi:hypothetical protein
MRRLADAAQVSPATRFTFTPDGGAEPVEGDDHG